MSDRTTSCRSELAREKPQDTAFIQESRIIVDGLREQACSYRGRMPWVTSASSRSRLWPQPW